MEKEAPCLNQMASSEITFPFMQARISEIINSKVLKENMHQIHSFQ